MKVNRKILVLLVVLLSITAAFAYGYSEYFSPPFTQKWSRNIGQVLSPVSNLVSDGALYSLDTNCATYFSSSASYILTEQNVSSGQEIWAKNITMELANSFPQIYDWNGTIILAFRGFGYSVNNVSSYVNYTHEAILSLVINASNGSLLKSEIYNYTAVLFKNDTTAISSDSSIKFSDGSIYSSVTEQLGLGYYLNGVWTGNFIMNVFGMSVYNGTKWNSTFEWQGDPNDALSNSAIQISPDGGFLTMITEGILLNQSEKGTSTVLVLNSYNGSVVWSKSVPYFCGSVTTYAGSLYYVADKSSNYTLYSFDLADGKQESSFAVGNSYFTLAQGHFLFEQNGSYVSYSSTGKLEWTAKVPYTGVDNFANYVDASSNGYVLFSSVRGTFLGTGTGGINYMTGIYGYYSIANLSTGKILWSKGYYPLSQVLNRQGTLYIPVMLSDNYLVYSWSSNSGTEHIMVANLNGIL